MIEYINNNIFSFWFVVGFVLLAVEILAFGFSTGFVLFIGLAALATGGGIWFGVVPGTWLASIASFTLLSVVISAILWKPLKSLQNERVIPKKDNSSDLIGLRFRLESDIDTTHPGRTHYSGIEWLVEIDLDSDVKQIEQGTTVQVVSVDAGIFRVIPFISE